VRGYQLVIISRSTHSGPTGQTLAENDKTARTEVRVSGRDTRHERSRAYPTAPRPAVQKNEQSSSSRWGPCTVLYVACEFAISDDQTSQASSSRAGTVCWTWATKPCAVNSPGVTHVTSYCNLWTEKQIGISRRQEARAGRRVRTRRRGTSAQRAGGRRREARDSPATDRAWWVS
jgi:hypothetical protein